MPGKFLIDGIKNFKKKFPEPWTKLGKIADIWEMAQNFLEF